MKPQRTSSLEPNYDKTLFCYRLNNYGMALTVFF